MRHEKLCTCGSRRPRYPLVDAAGIFCTYVCEKCEYWARMQYNPSIFGPSVYAATGNEEDIGLELDNDM
jgi:hypothetical protein